jgi:hypothetical protein
MSQVLEGFHVRYLEKQSEPTEQRENKNEENIEQS